MKVGIENIGYFAPENFSTSEDSFTLAVRACEGLLSDVSQVGACYFGSETKPYAVKSTAAMIASTLGLPKQIYAADLEFACKAGTSAMQVVCSLIESGRIRKGIAVASDVPHACEDDPLSSSVGSGAVCVVLSAENYFCEVLDYVSVADDISDFWRAKDADTPSHEGRFTGSGGYLKFIPMAFNALISKQKFDVSDIDHMVLHMPNGKYPYKVLEDLGLDESLLNDSFVFPKFKNCFSACSLMGLRAVLEKAEPNQNIIMVSYGSGAGADAFLLRTNEKVLEFQSNLNSRIWQ